MKDTIRYYYNIEIDDLEDLEGKYHFKYENQDFFFVYYNRGVEELEDLINVVNEMKLKGINSHSLILNINKSYLTKVGEYNYILFSVSNLEEEYDIFEIVKFQKRLVLNNKRSNLYRNNWAHLWSEKVDYFEYQVRELGLDKNVIKDSLSYYIGLAENAISYVNNAEFKYGGLNGEVTLSHRRIFYPNIKLNYMNPLSFIFDLRVRDIAEYLKATFFKKGLDYTMDELRSYLSIEYLSIYELEMLYARLLYPSFYFDIYDNIMNKDGKEEVLLDIIKKTEDYELFLKEAYLEVSKYAKIDKIDWLIDLH